MPALIIIFSIIVLLALLLSLKITLRITYEDSLRVYLKVFFVKTRLYPSKKKEKKYPHSMSKRKAQKIKDSLQKKSKPKKKKKKEEKPIEKNDLISIVSITTNFVKNFISTFTRAVRVKFSRMHITVASEDAATTAILYGAITQSVNVLFPLIDNIKSVKKLPSGKELSVIADFLTDKPTVDIDINLYVRVGGALKALFSAGIRTFKKAVRDKIKELERRR